ncbi:hypothetical protein [Bosea sp. PAMC 26642]|uniref:hypothetical protein n=1 Tax=Bosea sp. (strain PAMC 26642) TaxID=1792307 RepID=UPI00077062A7|nr:hypothetical protein [Bosea sp. PAMC 26642]AMJ60812.1 hypothetical protein AXW83_11365 [Bosea sp. PAMC 26642]
MLIAFMPFIVFAIVDRIFGATAGLVAAAATSVILLVRDVVLLRNSPKILEVGTALLFAGLAAYTIMVGRTWSVTGVRLWVDAGLLLIVLVSMIVGRPFTQQYARENVDPSLWDSPRFIRTNYVITGAWALAFGVMVIAELVLLYVPGLPQQVGVIAIVLALVGAFKFTGWYPQHIKSVHNS